MPRELKLPKKLNYLKGNGFIQYSYKWWQPSHIALVFFVVLWDGFLIFWHTTAWSQGNIVMMVFASIHTVVGLFLTYYLFAQIFNRTDVVLDQEFLDIHNYPIPWTGNRSIPVGDIKQLFVKNSRSFQNGKVIQTHKLYAILRSKGNQQILSSENDEEVIAFLEKEIEEILNIEDRKIE